MGLLAGRHRAWHPSGSQPPGLGPWSRLRTYDLPKAWVRKVAMQLATDRFRRARRGPVAVVEVDDGAVAAIDT
jgi:DNA-directed RNA polymerase specialized sigma24 family protein